MNLFDYAQVIYRRGWILVLAVLITAGAALIYSELQTPVYRASQKVLVKPARNDLGLAETLRGQLSSYVQWLYTDLRASRVIEALELDMTPGELRSYSTIDFDPTALFIQIDVDLEDPDTAAQIANQWGILLVEWRELENADLRREDRIEAELLDYPQAGLYRPNTRINLIAGAILGALVGGIAIFVLEFLQANILKTRDELERFVDIPIMAVIPDEVKR
jgi:capsular polysaccharide biosynthesis protein